MSEDNKLAVQFVADNGYKSEPVDMDKFKETTICDNDEFLIAAERLAEINKEMEITFNVAAETVKELTKAMMPVISDIIDKLLELIDNITIRDFIINHYCIYLSLPPIWRHRALHHKKHRVRQKYFNRILKEVRKHEDN